MNSHGQLVGDVVPGWSVRSRPSPVALGGRFVTVEPLGAHHASALHAALAGPDDDDLWTYRTTPKPAGLADTTALVDEMSSLQHDLTFALVPAGGRAQGMASYFRIDERFGQIEVAAVIFARALQRTPAATEAIHLLMRHAFDDLGYRRFEWKCDSLNEPSRRAAMRLGFTHEGRFRNHLITKGRNRDTDWFSVTDAEWPTVRAVHERWLDPSNFDASGRQRTRLSDLTGD